MVKNTTYIFELNLSAILIFVRTNRPANCSGIISVDKYGYLGSVDGIDIKVENNKVTVTNTADVARCCIGIIE